MACNEMVVFERQSVSMSPTLGKDHDQEEPHFDSHKKSVIARVKEKAQRWRQRFGKKRQPHEDSSTPSWGVALEDVVENNEDPKYLGPPMYESELAPEGHKEHTRQHPVVASMISGTDHAGAAPSSSSSNETKEKDPAAVKMTKEALMPKTDACQNKDMPSREEEENISDTMTAETDADWCKGETLDSRKTTAEKPLIQSDSDQDQEKLSSTEIENETGTGFPQEETVTPKKTITETVSMKLAPAYTTMSEATQKIASKIQGLSLRPSSSTTEPTKEPNTLTKECNRDKGVSVKEYIRNKLEPGEDERALSQVISEAISPRRNPGEKGVMEKVKEAVTLLLQTEKMNPSMAKSSDSPRHIPVSTNAHEVEEEDQGRILQAN